MFCSHCGKEVTVGAQFCPNCGAVIENQSAPTEGQPKAPTVEQSGNPIKKPIAGNGQSGKGKKGMPKPLIIVAAALVLFIGFGAVLNLFGGGNKPNSDPNENQTQPVESQVQPFETQTPQGTEESYREYNPDDFKGTSFVTLHLTSDEAYQMAVKIYNTEDKGCGPGVASLFKSLFTDARGNCGIDLTYIGAVGENFFKAKQFYYKVEVEDIETFKNNIRNHTIAGTRVDTSEWTENDEIYVRCDYYPPNEEVRIDFVFKNYTVNEAQKTNQNTEGMPTSTPNIVEAPVDVPIPDDYWAGHWIGTDEGVEMTVTAITDGYQIIIRETYDTNAIEYRLTGIDCLGLIDCEGEKWTIQYSGNGETTETLVGNCSGVLVEKASGESGYSVRFEGPGGEHILRFVKWGEPLPDWYVRDDGEYED